MRIEVRNARGVPIRIFERYGMVDDKQTTKELFDYINDWIKWPAQAAALSLKVNPKGILARLQREVGEPA